MKLRFQQRNRKPLKVGEIPFFYSKVLKAHLSPHLWDLSAGLRPDSLGEEFHRRTSAAEFAGSGPPSGRPTRPKHSESCETESHTRTVSTPCFDDTWQKTKRANDLCVQLSSFVRDDPAGCGIALASHKLWLTRSQSATAQKSANLRVFIGIFGRVNWAY